MYHRYGYQFLLLFVTVFSVSAASAAEVEAGAALSDQFSAEILQLSSLVDGSAYDEAYEKGQALLPRVRAEFSGSSYDEAKILDFMVYACYRGRRVMEPEVITMGEKAIRIKEVLLGSHSPELATSLMHMGNLFTRRWEAEQAIPFFDRALIILEVAGPDYDDQRAIILSSEGVAYRRMAQGLVALEYYGQALAIQERLLGPDHPDVASTLNNQAVVLAERGDYSASANLHRRAAAIRENHFGPDSEWVGESLHNLANQLSYQGQYDEALALGERVLEIFAKELGTDHQRYWWAQENLGITYLDMGDYSGARSVLEMALDGLEKRFGLDNPNLCFALDALAGCYFEMGKYEKALALYSRSLVLAEAAFGEGSQDTADTIGQQGKCLIALGRLDEALERLNRSLAIWEASLAEENSMLCGLHNNLAELHLLRGDYGQALVHATNSAELSLRDLGENHPLRATASLLVGRAHYQLGNNVAALEWALRAEEISRNHLQQTMYVLSEGLALDYAGSRVDGLNLALSVLEDGEVGERVAEVWDAVIRSRSVVLDEYTARNRFLSDRDDPVIASLQDSSLVLRERLANLTLRGPGWEDVSVYNQMLTDTEADLQGIERQLSLRSASFRHWQKGQQKGFAQVAEALPTGSALVAFVRFRDESDQENYKVFVLSEAEVEPRVLGLGQARPIDAAVAEWRDQATFGVRCVGQQQQDSDNIVASRGFLKVTSSTEDQLASYIKTGEVLRRLVWDPVAPEIGDLGQDDTVYLVADGSLHLLSFPSLPTNDGRFLVETGSLMHIITSEKALVRDEAIPVQYGRLLALGGAEYGSPSSPADQAETRIGEPSCSALENLEFSPLPNARLEVQRIGDIWSAQGGQTTLLSGTEATEDNLKRNLANTQVIHLATHGFFQPGTGDTEGTSRWDNPLVRSGLALAGANNWQQAASGNRDGILTAQEISALDLTGVQWAVLSACDTGLGELDTRGEGVFGLRRVFTLAGAQTVIMSLWSVDDESSRHWMSVLYRARWQDGMSTAEAMRQASLEVLAQRRTAGLSIHPYYWAAFVAAGDWR